MKFTVKVKDVDYNVETSRSRKLSYIISHEKKHYEIFLSANNDWISADLKHGTDLIPVIDIGEAIQAHFHN